MPDKTYTYQERMALCRRYDKLSDYHRGLHTCKVQGVMCLPSLDGDYWKYFEEYLLEYESQQLVLSLEDTNPVQAVLDKHYPFRT